MFPVSAAQAWSPRRNARAPIGAITACKASRISRGEAPDSSATRTCAWICSTSARSAASTTIWRSSLVFRSSPLCPVYVASMNCFYLLAHSRSLAAMIWCISSVYPRFCPVSSRKACWSPVVMLKLLCYGL